MALAAAKPRWRPWRPGCVPTAIFPWVWCFSPSPLQPPPSLPPPLRSQTQQEAGPGFALVGTVITGGSLEQGGPTRPRKDLRS